MNQPLKPTPKPLLQFGVFTSSEPEKATLSVSVTVNADQAGQENAHHSILHPDLHREIRLLIEGAISAAMKKDTDKWQKFSDEIVKSLQKNQSSTN